MRVSVRDRDLRPEACSHESRCPERNRLDPDRRADGRAARQAEPSCERGWQWHQADPLERRPLRAVAACERRTLEARAEVRPQAAALTPWQHAVELERDRPLGLAAGERAFELLAKRSARAKDQRLHCGLRHPEHRSDLGVGPALELPHREHRALVEAELREGAEDVLALEALVLGRLQRDLRIEPDLARPARALAEALPADVVRDRDQPVERLIRTGAALECTIGVEEGGLSDVLGVRRVAEHGARVAVDLADVPPVQPLERAVRARVCAPQHAAV